MLDFTFYNPVRIVFGEKALNSLPDMLKKYGATKILLHYGSGSIKENGAYDAITALLSENGYQYFELGGVQPNPRITLIREGAKLCKEKGIDFILAIGGGSVIDSAKGIAAGAKVDYDIWEHYTQRKPFTDAIPLGVVLTIAAAGSETSAASVVSDPETNTKRPAAGEAVIAKFAIMNPVFTMSLPARQTANGACDIIAHLLERYFTTVANVDFTDRLLESAVRSVLYNAPIAIRDPKNYAARAELMWAGTVAHNGLLGTGRMGDWGSHDIGHELSGFYDLAHGTTLSILFPAWMKYVYKSNPAKFVQFAQRVFDVDIAADQVDDIVNEMILRLETFFVSIGLPTRLSEVGIDDSRFVEMAQSALRNRPKVGNYLDLHEEDIVAIYRLAL